MLSTDAEPDRALLVAMPRATWQGRVPFRKCKDSL